MGDDMQAETRGDGGRPSAFDRALALTEEQTELLEVTRALIREHHDRRATLIRKLRTNVADYTRVLRDDGVPPERVLALVKAAVTPALAVPMDERRSLMNSIVHWCVEAYYAA